MPQLLTVVVAIALGNGLLIETAMLRTPLEPDERRVLGLVLLAPLEVFVATAGAALVACEWASRARWRGRTPMGV